MLHYNFPPYCVGETGFVGSPKRREIGHGKLAKRGVQAVHAERRGLPVHDPRRLRDHRVERLELDGLGLRHLARADGRRRPAQGAGRGHRDGPDQGGGRARRALRHPRRRGSSRRHGLQGRRLPGWRHGAADGHQDPGHHARHHGHPRSSRRRPGGCTSSTRWARCSTRRATTCPSTRRASSPCASTPRRSPPSSVKGGAVIRALTEETGATIDIGRRRRDQDRLGRSRCRRGGQAPHRADHRRHRGRHDLRGARAEA